MSSSKRPTLFVTGAAAGIGRAVAERFLKAGWFVGLYDVDEAGLRSLQQKWGADQCIAARLDVTSTEDWRAALAGFEQAAGGRLDVLFNNAGIAVTQPFEEAALERAVRGEVGARAAVGDGERRETRDAAALARRPALKRVR